jgi:AcrR family transcriptional regulator
MGDLTKIVNTVNNMCIMLTKPSRELILDAAESIAREQGLGALSMRTIAERTGLSVAAAYRHFAHKDALVEALVLRGYQGFIAGLEAARYGLTDRAERLATTFRYYLSFWVRDRRAFEFMAERGSTKNGLSGQAIAEGSFGDIPQDVALLLRDLPPQEAARVGRWTAASLYGIALSFSADPQRPMEDLKEDIDSAVDYLVRAILAKASTGQEKLNSDVKER